jgi:hypothetical protein
MRFLKLFFLYRSRDSIFGIAASYMLDGPGLESHQGQEIFSETVQTGSGAHPASCLIMGTGVLAGGENSPPSVPTLRMSGAILLLPSMPSWTGTPPFTFCTMSTGEWPLRRVGCCYYDMELK